MFRGAVSGADAPLLRLVRHPDSVRDQLLLETDVEHIDHWRIAIPPAQLGPLIDDFPILVLEPHIGERVGLDRRLRVDGSQAERPDATIADHLHRAMDVLVGSVGDLDLDRVVEPRRLRSIDRGDEFVSSDRVELIDFDRDLGVTSAERRGMPTLIVPRQNRFHRFAPSRNRASTRYGVAATIIRR